MYVCDQKKIAQNNVVRSLLLRYLAYTNELTHIPKQQEKAENLYRKAIDIANQCDNTKIARRICKDMAEFNWNRDAFQKAELCYWEELSYLLSLHGFYHKTTIQCLNNTMQAIINQNKNLWNITLHGFDLLYNFITHVEGCDNLEKHIYGYINQSLTRLSEVDPGFDPKAHQINMIRSFYILSDYLMSLEQYQTAYNMLSIVASSYSEFTSDNIENASTIYYGLMKIHFHHQNYHYIIHTATFILEQEKDIKEISISLRDAIKKILADTYRLTYHYPEARQVYHSLDNDESKLLEAECYRATCNYQKALSLIESNQTEKAKQHPDYHWIYGNILMDNGYAEDALRYFNACQKRTDYQMPQIEIALAQAELLLKHDMKSLQRIHLLIEKLENNQYSLYHSTYLYHDLALFMVNNGNFDEAERINNKFHDILKYSEENNRQLYMDEYYRIQNLIQELRQ